MNWMVDTAVAAVNLCFHLLLGIWVYILIKKIKIHSIRILSIASYRSINLSKCKKECLTYMTYEFSH